jgi:hypothetical protein
LIQIINRPAPLDEVASSVGSDAFATGAHRFFFGLSESAAATLGTKHVIIAPPNNKT